MAVLLENLPVRENMMSALASSGDEGDWGQEEKGTTEDEMVGWHH